MDKKILEQLKIKLETEKEKITKSLSSFADADPNFKGDWDTRFPDFGDRRSEGDENADETEEYANLLPVEHSLELRLKNINNALDKISKGEYGQCENCGKKIEMERLKVVPEARLCLKCTQK